MTNENTVDPQLGSVSRSKYRSSEPYQFPPRWDPTAPTDLTTCFASKHISIPPAGHYTTKLVTPRSQSSATIAEFLLHKPSLRTSTTESSEDSLSTESRVESPNLLASGWQTSIFHLGPLLGLSALFLVLTQIFASYTILKLSDGHPVTDWKYRPSVYLAILAMVSDSAMSFALAQGAVVTFWLRSLRGTTLAQLHRDWSYGSGVYNAIRAGRNVSILAVSCVLTSLVVAIDGPLLQRASSTQLIVPNRPVNLEVSLVPEIPANFSGSYQYHNGYMIDADFSDAILPIAREYGLDAPITGSVRGCNGTCALTIRAPALVAHHCESHISSMNFSAPYTSQEMKYHTSTGGFPPSRLLFKTTLAPTTDTNETLDFHTYLTGDEVAETCAGSVNSTHCYLRSAIAEYKVHVTNGIITLKDPENPRFISWANNTALTNETASKFDHQKGNSQGSVNTTLGGIANAFLLRYEFNDGALPPRPSGRFSIEESSKSWFMFQHTTNNQQYDDGTACSYGWKDPRPAVMAGLNELMFRVGVHVANNYDSESLKHVLDSDVQTRYNATGLLISEQEVFKSDFIFYFGAVAVELLTIMMVASTFSGFSRLGRDVSFSPLEIAKAFDAPLLAGLTSNLPGNKIASRTDALEVQYGVGCEDAEIDEQGQKVEKLMISHRDRVRVPESRIMSV